MSGFRDDAPPWSFFIPVTLAVIVGVLAADAIRYAVGTILSGDSAGRSDAPQTRPVTERAEQDAPSPAPTGTEPARPQEQAGGGEPGPDPADAPVAQPPVDGLEASSGQGMGAQPVEPTSVEQLPGPISARRDQAEAACIHGTVVYRSGNGWEQALENDAPVRCEASSP